MQYLCDVKAKPRRITAHCRIFLDVNPMPAPVFSRFQDVNNEPIIIPRIIAKIGLPINENAVLIANMEWLELHRAICLAVFLR